MSTSPDSDDDATFPGDEVQGSELEVQKPDIALRTTPGDLQERSIDGQREVDGSPDGPAGPPSSGPAEAHGGPVPGLPVEVVEALASWASWAAAEALAENAQRDDHDIEPRPRKMDPIDLSAYIVASRYRTFNLVMILLASAACVAAVAFGFLIIYSHANPGFTIGLTSAGTVAITVAAATRTVKRRREKPQQSQANGADPKDTPESLSRVRCRREPAGTRFQFRRRPAMKT